jgi:acetyl-CoA carboxylase biotin carboxyl carrier protein
MDTSEPGAASADAAGGLVDGVVDTAAGVADTAGGAVPADADPGVADDELLAAVEASVHDLVAGLPHPPAVVRVSAGGVTVEVEWAVGAAAGRPASAPAPRAAAAGGPAIAEEDAGLAPHVAAIAIRSPSTGAFYRAPSPGDPPFVEVGDVVRAGQQVGVVESMKLFFPVEAGEPGRVSAILKQDGETVEHGEPVITLEPPTADPATDPPKG